MLDIDSKNKVRIFSKNANLSVNSMILIVETEFSHYYLHFTFG